MPNAFSKEEIVDFDNAIIGFKDKLVLSRNVEVYQTDSTTMERAGDTIWRPQPYIAQSFDGMDQTSNFTAYTQLSVPATLGFSKSVPLTLNAKEKRDKLQQNKLSEAAMQKLASDVNLAIMAVAANQGTLVMKRTAAASGYDDVAVLDTLMNEQGIDAADRYLAYSSRDYNNLAKDLAGRQTMTGKPVTAYEKSYVGMVSSFETYKFDYATRLAAAAGGGSITINTLDAGVSYYVPKATATGTTGVNNVDNRYQTVTVSSTTSVAAGDAFTIAGIDAVHHITKGDTGNLKTFRVISVTNGTTMVISPPIISAQIGSPTPAEKQYQNCIAVSKSATAAIVWLNTVVAPVNIFWQKDSLELLPGHYAIDADEGAAVMRATTENSIEVVMQKQYDINTMITKFRWDILFGVCNKQPEMSGIELFSQT